MKPSFDLNSMKEFGTEHVEKFAFGGVVLLLLVFATRAVHTVGEGRPSFTPEDLEKVANNARDYWQNTSAQEYLKDSGIEVRDYGRTAFDIRNPIEAEPYVWPVELTPPQFKRLGGRDQPGLKPLEQIRATAGHGAVAAGGGAGLGRGVRGTRWVLVTGLLPIKSQFEAFEQAFEDAEYRNLQGDIPTYVGYRVERAEVSATGETEQLSWRPISLRRAFAWTRLWGTGPASRDLVHRKFYPVQPAGVWPMVFPLPPLVNANWGPEVAHPPDIPLLADMPEEERRALGMYAGQFPGLGEEVAESEGEGLRPEGEPGMPDDFDVLGPGGLRGPVGVGGFGGSGGYEGSTMGMEEDDSSGSYGPPMGPSMPGSSYPASMPFGSGSGSAPYGPDVYGRPGMTRQVEKPVEYQLFRFMDFDVEPGRRYRYRVKLVLANPNYKVNVRYLTDASVGKSWYIEGEWSDPTEVVSVPRDSRLLAGPVKPPPPGMELVREPTAQVIAVTIRMEDGLEAAHEYKVARGKLADFEADLTEKEPGRGMPVPGGYGTEEEDMGSAAMGPEVMGSAAAMAAPMQPLRRGADEDEEPEKITHATGMLLLDIAGGERLHRTDRTLTEPGALLLLDPDGNLVVSDELDDEEEFLAFHVPEEQKRPRKPKRPPTGVMGEEGGSAAGMEEEMYGDMYEGMGVPERGARRRRAPRRGGRRDREED